MSYLISSLADIDDCVNHTCVDTHNSFLCKCVAGFGGNHRQKKELLLFYSHLFDQSIHLFNFLSHFFYYFVCLFLCLSLCVSFL